VITTKQPNMTVSSITQKVTGTILSRQSKTPLCFGVMDVIAVSYHWVKGHTELITQPLSRDEILNIDVDLHTDVVHAQAIYPLASMPNCAHWDIEGASLSISGSQVTSDTNTQLTSQMHDGYRCAFLMIKETWSLIKKYSALLTGMLR
jgi:hypothetical protein